LTSEADTNAQAGLLGTVGRSTARRPGRQSGLPPDMADPSALLKRAISTVAPRSIGAMGFVIAVKGHRLGSSPGLMCAYGDHSLIPA
jgi:hypothetical protein